MSEAMAVLMFSDCKKGRIGSTSKISLIMIGAADSAVRISVKLRAACRLFKPTSVSRIEHAVILRASRASGIAIGMLYVDFTGWKRMVNPIKHPENKHLLAAKLRPKFVDFAS